MTIVFGRNKFGGGAMDGSRLRLGLDMVQAAEFFCLRRQGGARADALHERAGDLFSDRRRNRTGRPGFEYRHRRLFGTESASFLVLHYRGSAREVAHYEI